MANQFNYEDELVRGFQRPERIRESEAFIISLPPKQVLFGTSLSDNIELWFYNPDGTFAAHTTVPAISDNLKHTTIVDQTGAYEFLNINLQKIGLELNLAPGQYNLVANIFSDEIGNEAGEKLYISKISPDRTELQLRPVNVNQDTKDQIFEFIVPGTPRQFTKGLIDQIFGQSLDKTPGSFITQDEIKINIDQADATALERIQNSNANDIYTQTVQTVLSLAYNNVLELLATDIQNRRVQKSELEGYIRTALTKTIHDLNSSNSIDPHFLVT